MTVSQRFKGFFFFKAKGKAEKEKYLKDKVISQSALEGYQAQYLEEHYQGGKAFFFKLFFIYSPRSYSQDSRKRMTYQLDQSYQVFTASPYLNPLEGHDKWQACSICQRCVPVLWCRGRKCCHGIQGIPLIMCSPIQQCQSCAKVPLRHWWEISSYKCY